MHAYSGRYGVASFCAGVPLTAYLPCTSSQSSSRLLFKRANFYVYLIRRKKSLSDFYVYTFICIISPMLLAVFPLLRSNEQPKWKTIMTHFKALKLFAMKINTKAWRTHIFFIIVPELSVINLATRVPSKTFCWKNFFFSFVRGIFFCPGLDFNAIRVMMIKMVMITMTMMMMNKKNNIVKDLIV